MRNIIFIVLVVLMVSNFCRSQSFYNIKFQHLSINEGLSQSSVYAINQDNSGFMWFGTGEGLNKYDGNKFASYKFDLLDSTSISGNWITCIYEDKNQNLWIGTDGGGLSKYDKNTMTFKSYTYDPFKPTNTISNNSVYALCEDDSANLWIGTNKGLDKLNINTDEITHFYCKNKILYDKQINSIYKSNDKKLWISTNHSGLFVLDLSTNNIKSYNTQINSEIQLSHNSVWNIVQDVEEPHIYWIATFNGLNKINLKTQQATYFKNNPKNTHSICGNDVRVIMQDKKGNLWIGTAGNGLSILTHENKKRGYFINNLHSYNNITGLSKNQIYSIYQDRSGVVWIGTKGGGINKYQGNNFYYFKKTTGDKTSLEDNSAWSIYEDRQGDLWIGYHYELYHYKKGQHFSDSVEIFRFKENKQNGFNSDGFNTIAEDSKGNIWIGTYSGGVNKLNRKTGKITYYTSSTKNNNKGIVNNYVRILIVDSKDIVWVGTAHGLSRIEESDNKTIITNYLNNKNNPFSLSHNRINALYQTNDGNIWIGTSGGGLNMIVPDKTDPKNPEKFRFKCYKPSDRKKFFISDVYIMSLYEDKQGNLWVGTYDGGLNKLDRKTDDFIYYTEKDGLPNNVIYGILGDKKGNLWLSTNNGLSKFNPKDTTFTNYDYIDGLQSNEFNRGAYHFNSKTNTMYFGGINGLTVFNPDKIIKNTYIPPVVLTDFKIFNKSVHLGENSFLKKSITETKHIDLSYREYLFSIDFAALSYRSSHKNKYSYKMIGFDKDWISSDNGNRTATYTNLEGGTYTFKVIASNNDGIWNNKGVELEIYIKPPFWKTLWFRILSIIIIITILFIIYKRRVKSIEKRKETLEEEVKLRTQEIIRKNEALVKQKEEILSQKEELLQLNEEISAQKDLVENKNILLNEQNESIKASIRYALTIQKTILPNFNTLNTHFHNFLIFKPRDIVSGDFYWFTKIHNKNKLTLLVAVIDCTGHGVPGAFMSLISNRMLNEIVKVKQITQTDQILDKLDHMIREALKQEETDNRDGMDVALCKLTKTDDKAWDVDFTGAKRPLYYFNSSKNEIIKYKGTRRNIGKSSNKKIKNKFNITNIKLNHKDVIYLSSDGLIDQNAPNRKRFGTERLLNIISDNANLPLNKQKEIIENKLNNYQKNEPQRDDITILALKQKQID